MAKKLTMEDWDRIQKERPARYYVQDVKDGKKRVTFQSEITLVEPNKEDLLGHIWEQDWGKLEALALVDGEAKLYSFGGVKWSFISDLIRVCKENNIKPEELPGCIFEIEKTEPFRQTIVYVGRADDKDLAQIKKKDIKIEENLIRDAKEVISDLKMNSPDLVKGGLLRSDFIKAAKIRGQIEQSKMEMLIPELEKLGILKVIDNRVFL